MSRTFIRRAALALTTGALSVGATAAAIAATDTTPPDQQASSSIWANEKAPRVTKVAPEQAANLSVLRRAQHFGDALTNKGTGPFGANLDLARTVDTAAGTVRVVPGDGFICLRAEDEAGSGWTCEATSTASSRPTMLTLSKPGEEVRMFTLIPDGYTATSVDGVALSITDNVAAAVLPASDKPHVVTAKGPTGSTAQTVPAP